MDEINENTYKKARSVCENICGRLCLPTTLKENDEVESVLVRHLKNYGYWTNNVWLRMTYNGTVGTWYDPDNKKDLTFLNFDHFDDILNITDLNWGSTKEHNAVMDYDGDWWSRAGIFHTSLYVLCELT